MAPSPSLARLPQPPEASFRSLASEWVTPHFLRLPETLGESLQVFGVAAFARVLSFLIEFSLGHSLYRKSLRFRCVAAFARVLAFLNVLQAPAGHFCAS